MTLERIKTMNNKYPRPQLKRNVFFSLNGTWLMNKEEIIVPSCRQEKKLHYEKHFNYEKTNDRVILHFSKVDQIAKVYLNNKYLGEHVGGYLPFEFEITDSVNIGDNKLEVDVVDELDKTYPYGKQTLNPSGMWYTPVTGIWGDVWYEEVPNRYIKNIKITPDLKGVDLDIEIDDLGTIENKHLRKEIENPILWTPSNPHLYKEIIKEDKDEVEIYYGLRTITIQKIDGINRVCLNDKPIIISGLLDQGYWKDTLFIPNCEDGYEKDILNVKELGYNLLRKHIKIEAEQFYYDCDRLGMLVMQDMVENGEYHYFRDTILPTIGVNLKDKVNKLDDRMNFFIEHSKQTLDHLHNHPSIIAYTIFNEGWGQFNADKLYDICKAKDSTRLYDATSGWFRQKKNDFDSLHIYFRNKHLSPKQRPMLLSECGGYIYAINNDEVKWGYGICKSKEELTNKIVEMYKTMVIPSIKDGLCGVIFTQISDVEGEVNGLYNFDRTELKVEKEKIKEINNVITNYLEGD
ncbi:MAG: glycoside hydrolase family 2 TIM barrel-domain containing protein [Erysipelotrichaceae bacterium]|nr:glycoside hydrolase family 2 TIM barrel-domain containing protein [Erysipelotrichaceae bacterium]